MKFNKVKALILAEAVIVGGVLIHYQTTQASNLIMRGLNITSVEGEEQKLIEEQQKLEEQQRLEEERLRQIEEEKRIAEEQQRLEEERIRREQEEAERQRLIQEEEERRRSQPHFNPYNVSELSNLSKEQISKMLEGTALHTLVNAYYWYEQQYQINAVFLMALTAEESGWGRSPLAISNNNLSGHKNRSGGWAYYNNWGECLEESFRLLSQEYVDPNGAFYTGPNMYDINLVYCPDPENPHSWANNISRIGYELLAKLNGGN